MIDPLPSDIFRSGQILNNTYEIEGVLGRGGTGEVYRVVNKVTGRVFAVKALNAQFSKNDDYVELMKREEEMRHIIHDSVVRYNECSRTDTGNVILVMDYIEGPSLAEAMSSRQMTEKELLIIAHRIAQGLVAAHGHGIVHRDLSPDNIILRDGEAENATLIDFGIAKDTAVGARTIVGNDFAGKYEYAAPEQIDGKAEARSDLYALGATLLAAFRGDTPFVGTTPGEIVRRKQDYLDLEGVPDRLGRLISSLSNPNAAVRPRDAAAAVAEIEELLNEKRSHKTQANVRKKAKKNEQDTNWKKLGFGTVGTLAVAVGLYFVVNLLLPPPLPAVSPYTLEASKGLAGRTMLTGHAPDETLASTLTDAFVSATGAPPQAATVVLAEGMPTEAWVADIENLLDLLTGLGRWSLSVSDLSVTVAGLASDKPQLDAFLQALNAWQASAGFVVDQDVQAGPELLSADVVAQLIEPARTCGPLAVVGDEFPLGGAVAVKGNVASMKDASSIENLLVDEIGSRTLKLDLTVFNEDICAIRDVLPLDRTDNISIWLGFGRDGSANLTGVFRTGQNPLVEVLVPSTEEGDYLWVMVVDNTGKVFHVLPNIGSSEQRIDQLGAIEGGVRRIPVLHADSVLEQDPQKLVLEVTPDNYGRSEVVAILSRSPLFEGRRPTEESTESVKEALTEVLATRESDIISVSTRIIDARQ